MVCWGDQNTQDDCASDENGKIRIRYRPHFSAGGSSGETYDALRVYLDKNSNSQHDQGEKSVIALVRVYPHVNYVALGDSYSSGEVGKYQDEVLITDDKGNIIEQLSQFDHGRMPVEYQYLKRHE